VLVSATRRKLVLQLQDAYRVSERRAVRVLKFHRSMVRYRSRRVNDDEPIRKRMEEIAAVRIRYGYRRIHILLRHEGWRINNKRVYRIYCQAGLNLRSKRPRRCSASRKRYHL
jgi:putative transposase